jgi:hypothetical protein
MRNPLLEWADRLEALRSRPDVWATPADEVLEDVVSQMRHVAVTLTLGLNR